MLGGGVGLLELPAGGGQVGGGLFQGVGQAADVGIGLVQLTVAFGEGLGAFVGQGLGA
ncbi:bacteriocin [Nonomuraea wenchangensis]|uniref:bacteriocin n=1 Tax=Nonomuraea wenchangensis TaxID=568860 RepID=UPI0011606767|nr:bacteriocin [Nonomuraea wenchangensis]